MSAALHIPEGWAIKQNYIIELDELFSYCEKVIKSTYILFCNFLHLHLLVLYIISNIHKCLNKNTIIILSNLKTSL
ncbi:hypothetical protein Cyrtocomes_00263 [Candidatus Cyrtobacter comes]|uniref:Uncharacterized protein n=1 Tax=Candidatus Cyrtobacter comes TaxID=675776 RepID=A0ABU5L703_9RICK|nr:hypothetical protein [Candidatus Cyrtobacter comes]